MMSHPDSGTPIVSPDEIRDHNAALNEATFSHLFAQYESTTRDEEFLAQALESVRVRRRVLEAAVGVLNEPQKASVPGNSGASIR